MNSADASKNCTNGGAKMKRREFLQKGAIVVAGAAVAVSGVNVVADAADQWTGSLKTLNAHEGETLLKVARQIFPHDRLADTDYIVVVMDLDTEAAAKPETAKVLRDGVANLDSANGAKFVNLSDDKQLAALQKVDDTPFFQKVHSTEVVSLYNNHAVWKKLGYQGPSYQIGGYLHHGFNDLNWLPDPPASASPKPA
jgi:hypothetical protein